MAKKNLPTRDRYRHEQRSQHLSAVRQSTIPRIIQKTFGSIYFELFILAAVSLFLRWNLIDIPLERDEGSYAILGKMAMEGLAPYRDFYEMKPPFIFYTYGLLVELFGFSHVGLHCAAGFIGYTCVISVYFLAGLWFGVGFRFWGGLTFAFLLSNPYTTAVFLESELVVLAFVLPGILALLRVLFGRPADMTRRVEAAHLWLSGFLIASGILVKQTGVYFLGYAIAMALLHLLFQGRNRDFSRFFSRSAWFLAGGATAGLIGASILTGFGVWDEFWYWNVEYIKLYTSAISGELPLKAFLYGFKTVSKYFQYYWI
ncbi:MAG: ArnT family glycosyltransferase, partial [Saprospiraceae bacterium]